MGGPPTRPDCMGTREPRTGGSSARHSDQLSRKGRCQGHSNRIQYYPSYTISCVLSMLSPSGQESVPRNIGIERRKICRDRGFTTVSSSNSPVIPAAVQQSVAVQVAALHVEEDGSL